MTEFVLDHPGSIRKSFAALVRAANLPLVTPYVLRHSWCTHAIASGVPPALVARLMGDSVETIMRNYEHLVPGHLRDAVEVWGGVAEKEAER